MVKKGLNPAGSRPAIEAQFSLQLPNSAELNPSNPFASLLSVAPASVARSQGTGSIFGGSFPIAPGSPSLNSVASGTPLLAASLAAPMVGASGSIFGAAVVEIAGATTTPPPTASSSSVFFLGSPPESGLSVSFSAFSAPLTPLASASSLSISSGFDGGASHGQEPCLQSILCSTAAPVMFQNQFASKSEFDSLASDLSAVEGAAPSV
jgi:hypothetical protein